MKCRGFPPHLPIFTSSCNVAQTLLEDQVGLMMSARDKRILHPEERQFLLLLLLHLGAGARFVGASKPQHPCSHSAENAALPHVCGVSGVGRTVRHSP